MEIGDGVLHGTSAGDLCRHAFAKDQRSISEGDLSARSSLVELLVVLLALLHSVQSAACYLYRVP